MGDPSKTVGKQKKPSFFKILFDDFSAGLQFPPAFTKKFGNQIPNTSKLEVKGYHERSWEVEVEKIGEIYCFRKGWREFVEENNLEHWDFLVFKYLTDSKLFKVTIYGRTGCVKEFPVSRERNSEPLNGNSQRNVQDGEKKKCVQEDDDDSNTDQELKGTRMIKCEFDGHQAYESHVIHIDSDSSEDENLGDFIQTRCNQRTNNETLKRGGKSNGLPTDDHDENQIEFNSQNPFFKIKLKNSNVLGHYLVADCLTKIWSKLRTVGPTIPYKFLDTKIEGDEDEDEECTKWLDDQPKESVVLVSFGSLASLNEEKMEEVAWGLRECGINYVWVVRESEKAKLPKDFEKKSEKGFVVSWCHQMKVLSHEAIGCFVTHCGWNSSLEALSLGVPMVAIPQWSDQITNAKFITDVWKVGVKARVDEKGIVTREALKNSIWEVLKGEKDSEIKNNAIKWRSIAAKAVDKDGSSHKNIEEFVDHLLYSKS